MKVLHVVAVAAAMLLAKAAHSQVSAYADFSAGNFTIGPTTHYLYAPTVGVTVDLATLHLKKNVQGVKRNVNVEDLASFFSWCGAKVGSIKLSRDMTLAADLRGSFLQRGGNRLDSVVFGPKVSTHLKRFTPYGEFLVGFGRYNDGLKTSTSASTDSQFQVNGGMDFKVRNSLSWRVFDYGYVFYQGQYQQYDPQVFSTGVVYNFGGR